MSSWEKKEEKEAKIKQEIGRLRQDWTWVVCTEKQAFSHKTILNKFYYFTVDTHFNADKTDKRFKKRLSVLKNPIYVFRLQRSEDSKCKTSEKRFHVQFFSVRLFSTLYSFAFATKGLWTGQQNYQGKFTEWVSVWIWDRLR